MICKLGRKFDAPGQNKRETLVSLNANHKQFILPQFKYPEKVNIVECDAFEFAEKHMKDGCYNTVFTDIWHDPSDGCELYLRMKKYEYLLPDAEFIYWVENTLKLYL